MLDKVEIVGADHCFVTEITIAELFYGAAKSGRPEQFNDVEYILQSFDLLIGSCAVHNNLVMVTSNLKHFDHIPNITLEDWAQKSKYKK